MRDSQSSQAKLLRVVEALASAQGALQLGEVARASGLSKPSTHRLLASLLEEGYAQRDSEDRYVSGPALLALGAQTARHQRGLIRRALEELRNETGQTVHLAMRSHLHAVYTDKVAGTGAIQFASTVGAKLELHASGIGKVILAGMESDELAEVVVSLPMTQHTPWTITDAADLTAAVQGVREQGYAIDDEENEANVRCIAVGLRSLQGSTIGGISLSTIKPLLPKERLLAMLPALQSTAHRVERLL